MKAVELAKSYNPKDFEERIYASWKEKGEFRPREGKGEHFSIVMPPPNVTGILHMGHALNNSLQDIIIRYYRMTGRPTLWVPGTDHAGIATQNVVERQLKKEGLRRQDLGREKFLERTWQVKEKHHDIIKSQLEKMGCSCDWDHERFTMDEGLSRAVREAFVSLYERGLIYKGKYLVNYCPKCGTALSDDEVEYEEEPGRLYHVRYPYSDGSGYIIVATTRPETMFGDTAFAVHPEDERYKAIVGKSLDLPLTERKIKIIADAFVSREFGTGMVKITPAHDPNDFECGKRNNLEAINILNPDGTLNDNCPQKYRNLQAVDARKLVVEDLEKGGYIEKIEEHNHEVGHCYRCHTIVEPYLSDQWFVKMRSLADKAMEALEKSDIVFYPKRWENTYSRWLESIRDWCISRQLWWGHRIPVWYCKDCGHVYSNELVADDATTTDKDESDANKVQTISLDGKQVSAGFTNAAGFILDVTACGNINDKLSAENIAKAVEEDHRADHSVYIPENYKLSNATKAPNCTTAATFYVVCENCGAVLSYSYDQLVEEFLATQKGSGNFVLVNGAKFVTDASDTALNDAANKTNVIAFVYGTGTDEVTVALGDDVKPDPNNHAGTAYACGTHCDAKVDGKFACTGFTAAQLADQGAIANMDHSTVEVTYLFSTTVSFTNGYTLQIATVDTDALVSDTTNSKYSIDWTKASLSATDKASKCAETATAGNNYSFPKAYKGEKNDAAYETGKYLVVVDEGERKGVVAQPHTRRERHV